MGGCYAAGCNHTSESHKCKFYRFPAEDSQQFRTWVSMSRRADRAPTKSSRLCSCHFLNGSKENGPTIFERNKNKAMHFKDPEDTTKKRRSSLAPTTTNAAPSEPSQTEATSSTSVPPQKLDANALQRDKVHLEAENLLLKGEVERLQKKLGYLSVRISYEQIKNNERLVHHYTGLPSAEHFDALYDLCSRFQIAYTKGWTVRCLSTQDQLLLTLMKLRRNLSMIDLASRFSVGESTAQIVFQTLLCVLHEILFVSFMIEGIPSVRKNQASMPGSFSEFSSCRIVLDCTETQVANARDNMETQRQTYSNYKSRNTFKCLVGVAPNGVITYVSELYPGSKSDKEIVRDCGILSQLTAGDLVLADKGFLIQDLLPPNVTLNIPPFLTNGVFTKQESVYTIKIARARIHVERAIGRIKAYRVLDFIPSNMRSSASKIYQVCAALVNLQNPLIAEMGESMEAAASYNEV